MGDMRLWKLHGKRPKVTQVLAIGRAARAAAIHTSQSLWGRAWLPPILHHAEGEASHLHAHWQGEDRDGDGLIDHLSVRVPGGIDVQAAAVLDGMEAMKIKGTLVRLEPVLCRDSPSAMWFSLTPFVGPHHAWSRPGRPKRGQDALSQLTRELARLPWLPAPLDVWRMPRAESGLGPWLSSDIRGRDAPHHAEWGVFLLHFPYPVAGPVAAGALSHWGMGAFRAMESLKVRRN
jgi:hypothetical protein